MSRIGKKPVEVPSGVKVSIDGNVVTIEGSLGKQEFENRPEVSVTYDSDANQIIVTNNDDERQTRAYHGLTRALLQNMVVGVTQGYEKRLELVGVGYIASVQNNQLDLRVGLANELHKPIPEGLEVACPDQQHIVIKGINKQMVGQFAAETRALRKPEPYKGKGIRYFGEAVRRKQGKAMAK